MEIYIYKAFLIMFEAEHLNIAESVRSFDESEDRREFRIFD